MNNCEMCGNPMRIDFEKKKWICETCLIKSLEKENAALKEELTECKSLSNKVTDLIDMYNKDERENKALKEQLNDATRIGNLEGLKFRNAENEIIQLKRQITEYDAANAKLFKKNELLINDLIAFLKEKNPYPEDIFCLEIGKAARAGYQSAIYCVEDFLKELKEAEK